MNAALPLGFFVGNIKTQGHNIFPHSNGTVRLVAFFLPLKNQVHCKLN